MIATFSGGTTGLCAAISCDCFITCDESKGFGVLPQQVAWRALSAHMHHLLQEDLRLFAITRTAKLYRSSV